MQVSYQPRSQGLRCETVRKTLVKFVLLFQNFGKKIACAVRHNRIAMTVEYGCVSLRMRFCSKILERSNEFYQGLRHRLTAKALGPRLVSYMTSCRSLTRSLTSLLQEVLQVFYKFLTGFLQDFLQVFYKFLTGFYDKIKYGT